MTGARWPSRLGPVLLAAGLALSLGACIDLAPGDRRPVSPSPARFSGADATVAAESPPPAWRTFFVDPRLRAVIERALANNRDLRIATANVVAARGQYVTQRAALFPKLGATGSATYAQTPSSVVSRGQSGAQGSAYNERLYSLSGGFSAWQIDLFGRLRDASRASLDSYFATRQARDAAQVTLVGEVAADWLALAADRSSLEIAGRTLADADTQVRLTRARFDAGSASELDLAEANTVREQARYDVSRLTAQVTVDRDALDLVVGAPIEDDLLAGDIDAASMVVAELPVGLSSRVLLTRPDVLEAESTIKAANADIGVARAAFFPDISLTGSGGVTSLALSTLLRASSETWSFAPTVTQSIFDFGANQGALTTAKARRDADVAAYEKAIQTAFREVSDGLAQRAAIDTELSAQTGLVEAASTAFTLADARYRRGADTYLNALTAERTLFAARQTLVSTRLARATNLVTLYTALGGGL